LFEVINNRDWCIGSDRAGREESGSTQLEWIDCFINKRLLGPTGDILPAVADVNFYAQRDVADWVA
jgi:hypothetical protein